MISIDIINSVRLSTLEPHNFINFDIFKLTFEGI